MRLKALQGLDREKLDRANIRNWMEKITWFQKILLDDPKPGAPRS